MKINSIIRYNFRNTVKSSIPNQSSSLYYSNDSFKYNSNPINFGSNFLTRIDGLICPCCGIRMISPDTFNKKLQKGVLSGTSQKAVEAISKFEHNLHPTEKKCFDVIKRLSNKSPNSTLQELLEKEGPKHLERLQLRQLKIFDQIDIHLKNLQEPFKSQIHNISNEARKTIISEIIADAVQNKLPFKRKLIINAIENLKNTSPENTELQVIYKIALKLPNSTTDIDSFFVKYSRRSSAETGQRLVSKSVSTIEHTLPQSKDGKSNDANYIAECAGCNNSRGNILLNDWISINHKMLKYLRLYMKEIVELINTGRIKDHNDYPEKIIQTLDAETIKNEIKKEKPNQRLINEFNSLISDLISIIKTPMN